VIENILFKRKKISKKIKKDIGLSSQAVFQKRWDLVDYVTRNGKKYGKGAAHNLWSTPIDNTTWLYAEKDIITLKITPNYPWLFDTPQLYEEFYSFDEFVRNYKPIAEFTLSPEIAKEWLDQAHFIIKTIEERSERRANEYSGS